MNVKELKEALVGLPDDMEVILQKDSEGNGYSPLDATDAEAVYVPETSWHGEVYDTDWSADDACVSEEKWSEILARPRAFILVPTN